MSRRNALLVAIVAGVLLAVFFFWPERARADLVGSARIGVSAGQLHLGGRLHHGGRAFRGGLSGSARIGQRSLRHGLQSHGGLNHRRSFLRKEHIGARRLLGDRFRIETGRRLGGGRGDGLIGERFRVEQRRRLSGKFLGAGHQRAKHAHSGHRHPHAGHKHQRGERHRKLRPGRDWHRGALHGRHGKLRPRARLLLFPALPSLILRHGDSGAANQVVVVTVVPPRPRPRPSQAPRKADALDPRGPVRLVGEEDGVQGGLGPGDTLPRDLPHVVLDAATYGLPQAPPGQEYARVGNRVLRIQARDRLVVEMVAR